MRLKMLVVLACIAAAQTETHAAQPPEDAENEPMTPCESAAIAIAEHARKLSARANASTIPFDRADGAAKACGVLVRGIKELSEMSCPRALIDMVIEAQKESQETLDLINETYDFRFNYFVPDFL